MSAAAAQTPLFVVDDDPTGAQGQADVALLLSWRTGLIEATLRESPRALHLLTNSRALDADSAYAVVRDATSAVRSATANARLVMRGDSTLRAHLLPEYAGVRDVLCPGATPPLLVVPALPAAGRVTRDGRHWLVRDGRRVPLEDTEFARDGDLSYATSRLVDWADERSSGYFSAGNGVEVGHDDICSENGADRVRGALVDAARGAEPAVVVPDAETVEDLETIAAGLRIAWLEAPQILVRCAPTFASVLSGAGAKGRADLPIVDQGLLVVVGSHVPMTTAQLAALNAEHREALIEVDAATLAGDLAPTEINAAVDRARANLRHGRLAVVATTRAIAAEALGPEAGMRVARGLAKVVARLRDASDVLLSKGGITSAVNVSDGLGAERAQIVGPVAPGVSLWLAHEPSGGDRPVIVFPGNVGAADTLAELVDRLLGD